MKNKTRSLKELLILVRNNLDLIGDCGICVAVEKLLYRDKISSIQYYMLDDFLKNNLPKKRYPLLNYSHVIGNAYCWKPGAIKGRENWLNKQINLL